jgi:hypothetical protein
MDRKALESVGKHYPYLHLQGLYLQGLFAIPAGLIWFLIGLSNLQRQPVKPLILLGGVLLAFGSLAAVALYYRNHFGSPTPTRSRQVRQYVAIALGFAVFVGVDQLARTLLGRPPGQPVSSYAASWAVGMLVFYAIVGGLRAYHVVIWGSLFVAGVLPIWGLSVDRDALASFPIGAATMASGIFDHYFLVRAFESSKRQSLEHSNAGA